MECWRDVCGYPMYEVSDAGRVRRRCRSGYRLLKPLRDTRGYFQVSLHADGKGRRVLIHSLVAAAFLGPRPTPEHQINHKSGDKSNNSLSNLEYLTREQNGRHASATGLSPRGERNAAASLTNAEASEVKALLQAGVPQAALAARYRVGKSLISRIATGECWGWLRAAEGPLRAYLIRGRRTSRSRWRIAGCEDSEAAAADAVAAMAGEWHELEVLHGRHPVPTAPPPQPQPLVA